MYVLCEYDFVSRPCVSSSKTTGRKNLNMKKRKIPYDSAELGLIPIGYEK